MRSYFIDLNAYGESGNNEILSEQMITHALLRVGYHVFQTFLMTTVPADVQSQLNNFIESVSVGIPVHARVNIKMVGDAKSIVTFLF